MLTHSNLQRGGLKVVPGSVSPPLSNTVRSTRSSNSNPCSTYYGQTTDTDHERGDLNFSAATQQQGRLDRRTKQACLVLPSSIRAQLSKQSPGSNGLPTSEECQFPQITGVDVVGKLHRIELRKGIKSIAMSGLQLRSVNLSHLQDPYAEGIEDVSFAANHLSVFCLKWLSRCSKLERLSLNGNRLKRLDWHMLSSFPALERLWLHRNELENIDLSPLASCRSLRSLYLDSNCLNAQSVDLTPMSMCRQLRSLRMGGNTLGGQLDVTPLLLLPLLKVFDVDSSVQLFSTRKLSLVRAPAFRKRLDKISIIAKEPGTPAIVKEGAPRAKQELAKTGEIALDKDTLVRPPHIEPLDLSRITLLDKFSVEDPPGTEGPDSTLFSTRSSSESTREVPTRLISRTKVPSVAIRTLLIGFRRLARYSVEDRLARAGKVLMRAVDVNIALVDPKTIYDSHLILLHNPSDKLVEQVSRIAISIPTVIVGSERYRSKQYDSLLGGGRAPKYFADPLKTGDADRIVNLGRQYAMRAEKINASQLSEPRKQRDETLFQVLDRERDPLHAKKFSKPKSAPPATSRRYTFNDILARVSKLRQTAKAGGISAQCERIEKVQAERAAIELAFQDLGEYGSPDTFAGIARTCGLPKCAGRALFEASVAATKLIEATTPETGVPTCGSCEDDTDLDMYNQKERIGSIHVQAFLAYWNKIKDLDPEARLSEVLQDSVVGRTPRVTSDVQKYSARSPHSACQQASICIKKVVTRFMENRKHRLGTFSLVKIEESIIIATSLLVLALQAGPIPSSNAVRERDVKRAHLNSHLIAAEAGRFKGLAGALSLDRIRTVKRKFAAESSEYRTTSRNGSTVGHSITEEEVVAFCRRAKTLTPSAVQAVFKVYCSNLKKMSLGQFTQFFASLTELSETWAANYFFSVMDVDMDGFVSSTDLKHFYLEEERGGDPESSRSHKVATDIWHAFCDLAQPAAGIAKGISRREFLEHKPADRMSMIKSALFVEEEPSNESQML